MAVLNRSVQKRDYHSRGFTYSDIVYAKNIPKKCYFWLMVVNLLIQYAVDQGITVGTHKITLTTHSLSMYFIENRFDLSFELGTMLKMYEMPMAE
ncbi:hypothetical protein Z042_00435 [Chania multitudinisentens RB-25]|uniref:Uncharacterized protein n=1 Tax=Chania multitudinisentens RB-25 TaxID=1441930 RepID=W0LFQ2_9GAMM|nr:hypothetical protein [Chania multitudinisentens]AHG22551.1 hypothetical protein Z042_00435 [Chania multitudinisentens RB-25]